jgi:tripartite-type tricarboxylate transporter receptor subunit TctC
MFATASIVFCACIAFGQDFPVRPIRVVAPEPGSGTDFMARVVTPAMSATFGQPIVVDNHLPNAIGETVSRATPDGYTLAAGTSTIWITPLLRKTSYDPVKDFAPVEWTTSSPFILLVNPAVPANSVQDLITLARSKPGALNYSSGPTGGGAHLSGSLFKAMTGVNVVLVPYPAGPPGLNALIAGETQVMINTAATSMTQVRAGKVKALAVTSAEPTPLAPGLPTLASLGLPGYESLVITGFLAPAGTPKDIVNKLNREIVRIVSDPAVKDKFFKIGADVVISTPDEFAAKIKSEMSKWGKVLNEVGIETQ